MSQMMVKLTMMSKMEVMMMSQMKLMMVKLTIVVADDVADGDDDDDVEVD